MNDTVENVSSPTNNADAIKQAYTDGQSIPLGRWDSLVKLADDLGWDSKNTEFKTALEEAFPGQEQAERTAKSECRRMVAVRKHYGSIKEITIKLADSPANREGRNRTPAQIFDRVVTETKKKDEVPTLTALKKEVFKKPTQNDETDFRQRMINLIEKEQGKDEIEWDDLNEFLKAAKALKPHCQVEASA